MLCTPWRTGAIGHDLGTQFRRQAVIARQISGGTAAFHAEFFVEAHALMATGAGDALVRFAALTERIRIQMRLDGMNSMAISAHRAPIYCRERSPGRGYSGMNSCSTDSWHLAQVAGTLKRKMDECSSVAAGIS